MSKNTNSKKIKIIKFKDIVSLSVLVVMTFCSVTYSFGAVLNSSALSKVTVSLFGGGGTTTTSPPTKGGTTPKGLIEFNEFVKEVYENANKGEKKYEDYKVYNDSSKKSTSLSNLKYNIQDLPKDFYTDWKLANYTTVGTINSNNKKFPMTACTFIKETDKSIDIVITYNSSTSGKGWEMLLNGELFNENWLENITNLIKNDELNTGNWGQDIVAILLGYTGMEGEAQTYALNIAKHYHSVRGKKTLNIHVTGHSLGGYLAQIGGAKILQNSTYKNYVKQITYFNGFGLYVNNKISTTLWTINKISSTLQEYINKMFDSKLTIKQVDSIIQNAYTTLRSNKSKVTLYRIKGDFASPLGHHAGNIKEFYASGNVLKKQSNTENSTLKTTLKTLYSIGLFKIDCSDYPATYKIYNFMDYMWALHDLPAYKGINLNTGVSDFNVEAKLYSVPLIIWKETKKDKNADDIYLTIKLTNAQLSNTTLKASNFNKSSNLNIKGVSLVSGPTKKILNAGEITYNYTFKIVVTANKTHVPTINLKANALKIQPCSDIIGLSSKLNIKNESLSGTTLDIMYFEIMDT